MDLLFIAAEPPYPYREYTKALPFYLARELSSHRSRVDLVCFYTRPESIADVPRYERYFNAVKLIRAPQFNYRNRLKKVGKRIPTSADEVESSEMWNTISLYTSRRYYDFVQLFGGLDVYPYLGAVHRFPNLLALGSLESLATHYRLEEKPPRKERATLQQRAKVLAEFEDWIFQAFDTVTVLSQHDATVLRERDRQASVRIVPPGIDLDYYVPTGIDPARPAMLVIGDYQHPAMAEAAQQVCQYIFPEVKRLVPGTQLYVVGANPPDALTSQTREDLHVTGWVPDLRPFFELATVYVNALRKPIGLRKGVLEAMAMKTPIVSTPEGVEGYDIQHEQQVLIANGPDELMRACVRVMRDTKLRTLLQQSAHLKIEKVYSWNSVADQYETLYRQIISQRNF